MIQKLLTKIKIRFFKNHQSTGAASVARGYSNYLDGIFDNKLQNFFKKTLHLELPHTKWFSSYPDLFAFSLTMLLSGIHFDFHYYFILSLLFLFFLSYSEFRRKRIHTIQHDIYWCEFFCRFILCHCWII